VVATSNAGKAREIAAVLEGLPFRVLSLADLGIRADFEETGRTFAANARGKAEFYSRLSGLPTLADDSGLVVDALNGAPGVVSARFSGKNANAVRNNRKLLRELADFPDVKRGARFVCCMALARDGRTIKQVSGRVGGRILRVPRGGLGFGYDPLFYYRRLGRTFAELPAEVKNDFSHRGRALRKMAAFIADHPEAL
jgi:XTP/dITP diphosphohydrolase